MNYEQRQATDWQTIELHGETVRIPLDSALDFGGIGKGYLLDQLAEYLSDQDITNYWLSLGGDVICNGYNQSGEMWKIGIQHALSDEVVAHVENSGQKMAVATSGITKRKGHTENGQWHHIIDPRTGRPADTNILTATVCSKSATEADVMAKAIVIVGSDRADAFLETVGLENALLQCNAPDENVILRKLGTIWSV